MKEKILTIPGQIARGIDAGAGVALPPFRRIIVMGMGGSSIAGEILSMARDEVIVHWDYGLPKGAQGGDLVICVSWSGNTEETISTWKAARDRGLDTLAICSGGKLQELAGEAQTPLIALDHTDDIPRANAIYMTAALFAALGMQEQLPAELAMQEIQAQGEEFASAIGDRMLALYASHPWRKLTGFWKMAYSETVKRQVMVNWFPAGAHTEVVGWEGPYESLVAPILFRDDPQQEDERYAKNFEALLAILSKKGYNVHTVRLSGNTLLEKVFNSYLLALWTSYYAAHGLGIDPVAVQLLDEFKELKRQKTQG